MGFIGSAIKLAVIGYLAHFLYYWGIEMGIGLPYNEVKPGPCRIIPGISCGSEKISVTDDGLAFITNGFKQQTPCNKNLLTANLYLFDFNQPNENVTKLEIKGDSFDQSLFNPHGMDIYESQTDKDLILIYVINHGNRNESVEVFHYRRSKRNEVQHIKTLKDKNFVCLNDLVLLDENQFYATNYLRFCHTGIKLLSQIEFFLRLPTGNIIYYNNGVTKVATKNGESFINGLTLSQDKKNVLAALWHTGHLLVYNRDEKTGDLDIPIRHFIGFHPDNIDLDKTTNELYIGVTKSEFCIEDLANNKTDACEVTGTKLTPADESWKSLSSIEEILCMNGKNFVNVASSVVHYKEQYLIGTVYDGLAYCKVKK